METKTDRGILECMTHLASILVESCLKWDIYSTVVWCNSVKDYCKQGGATVEGNDWNMYANKEDYQYPTFTTAVKY